MMNIIDFNNSFISKDNIKPKTNTLTQKNDNSFSDILKKENRTLKVNNQSNNKETKNLNNSTQKQEIKNLNKEKEENDKFVDNKIPMDNLRETEKKEDIGHKKLDGNDTEKSKEATDKEAADHIISLINSLFNSEQINLLEIDENSDAKIKLDDIQIQILKDLNEELNFLLNKDNIEITMLSKENIEKTIMGLSKTLDETTMNSEGEILVSSEKFGETLKLLEGLKTNIEFNFHGSNFQKRSELKELNNILNMNKKESFKTEEAKENPRKANATELSIDGIEKDGARDLEKKFTNEKNENQSFLKQDNDNSHMIQHQEAMEFKSELQNQEIKVSMFENEIVEQKQFVNEIAQKASMLLSEDKNEMNIQLTPEKLGKLSIKIGLNDGTVTGKIYAENYSVKEIIEANLNQLKDALEEKGINIGGLEVNVGDNSQEFERNTYNLGHRNRKKHSKISMSNNIIGVFEENTIQHNPYIITSKFDGLA